MRWRGLTLEAKFTETSKHLGLFPEQSYHWAGIQERGPGPDTPETGRARLLNLFGYTGAASLAAAAAGFAVTHVDASKTAVTWARNNQERSGLAAAPIRWIIDDALKYVRREARRGSRYEALLLDPPSFGRGPKKEMWKAETHLHELILACREVLAPEPRFVLLTLYALEASSLMAGNLVAEMMAGHPGRVRTGELALREESAGRLLPLALWARWEMEH
jgi:23S rRNA (cytosine1962-C5)-methyltransferase